MMAWKGKRVLITGGAGFIGSHLATALVARGAFVIVVDNESNGVRSNLDEADGICSKRLDYHKEDICSPLLSTLFEKYSPIDCVFHEAAVASVPRSIAHPDLYISNNIEGTFNVLMACKTNGVRRIVFASSSSVYGDSPTLPKREGKLGKILSPYAFSKKVCEEMLQMFHTVYGLETVSLRYFNVFGPRQKPEGLYAAVIPLFINRMMSGESPTIFGDGEQKRDFTYIKNVVDANLLFATLPSAVVCGKVFNVSCGDSISVNYLVKRLNRLLGTKIKPEYKPKRQGDVLNSKADISLARSVGFSPVISFDNGLKYTVEYFKEVKKC